MNEQNNPILEVKNLRVSYHTYAGEVKAVRGVQFSLEKGQALAIVGESGCGKSVTAKSIMGLIKAPQGEIKENSEILYHGENILKYNKKTVAALQRRRVCNHFPGCAGFLKSNDACRKTDYGKSDGP